MMPTAEIFLPTMHAAQAHIEANSKRFNVICAGRRFGKDVLMQRKAILRIKNGYAQGWFAPSYRMMTENYKEMSNRLASVIKRASDSEHVIELKNNAVLDFWSLDNYNAARGRKYGYVTINEAAASPNLTDAWNYVIRPTLADLQGGADFGSTPKGLNGFYTMWAKAGDDPDWARFKYTTYDNPYIPVTEIEAMKDSLPAQVFQQEIMAEFLENGAFFQGINEAATIEKPDQPGQHEKHQVIGGLDWALTEDFTVLTLLCRDCNKVVDWWRIRRVDFTVQRAGIVDRCKRWHASILPERNSIGEPNIEMLMQSGVRILSGPDGLPGFNTTSATKTDLIQRLAAAMEHSGLKVPVDYGDELRAYEVEFTMGGHAKFGAPSGSHDDRVISLALANWAKGSYAPISENQPEARSKWTEPDAELAGWSKRY